MSAQVQANSVDVNSKAASLAKTLPPTSSSSGPLIAVDLDDVLSETNLAIAEWYNETFPGAQMSVDNFYYYYYWKNPYWGTLAETFAKAKAFYSSSRIHTANTVPGAREGVQALRDAGFRLIIISARYRSLQGETWKWVDRNFPGLFDTVICIGQFEDENVRPGHELVAKLTKQQVCLDLGAKLLIDDSLENALACATHNPPTPVLLFGDYEWNKRQSFSSDCREDKTFSSRLEHEGPEFWKKDDEKVVYPEGASLWRVKDWGETIRWIEQARKRGDL